MAEVTLASDSVRQVWSTKYWQEYIRQSGFEPYMGKSGEAIFQVRSELLNEAGKIINIPLITRLKAPAITGSQVLKGNEEQISNYNAQITIDWARNAVEIPKSTSYLTEVDLWGAAKEGLRRLSAEHLRDDLIQDGLGAITIAGATGVHDTVVRYASATAAQLNAFGVANSDRVLFGDGTANYSATWATALGNIGSDDDKLTTAVGSLAKRMARLAGVSSTSTSPHIRPFKAEDGREFYVMFCNPYAFRDLKLDTAMLNANRDARAREGNGMSKNPIFQDGDLLYDGVIYREIPELTQLTITGAGASSIDVAQNFLCGTQAVGLAYGQMPTPRTDLLGDYQFRPGVAIEELRGQRKLSLNGIQTGIFSVFTSGVAD